jgi:ATP-dependent DNA helicase RecG
LFADSKAENTIERLKIMEETENGFIIAQKDLEIRGPGELMGTRQSGLSDFGLASMATNGELLEQARDAARKLVMEDPELKHLPEPLKRKINSLKQKAQLIESA